MTTLLGMCQNVAVRAGYQSPTAIVGVTSDLQRQLLAFANEVIQRAANKYEWPKLIKEYTFTLSTSVPSYALPADINRIITETAWDRGTAWPLTGPLSAQEWQQFKSGTTQASIPRRFRVKGMEDEEFFIDPTPSSADNGLTMAFEYLSDRPVRPKTWVASTAFAAASYCFYDGRYYYTGAGGTTSTTAPTHTTGTATDGTVTWAYYSGAYNAFLADTDIPNIDPLAIEQGLYERVCRMKGAQYEPMFNDDLDRAYIKQRPARPISLRVNSSSTSQFQTRILTPPS